MDLHRSLRERRLLAIIRGTDPDACLRTVLTLAEEGVGLMEISLTSAGALDVLERVAAKAGAAARVGAGTVLTADDARRAREAGASFAVTPALCEGVEAAVELGLPVLAGAMTPSEVLAAHRAGATAVKLFPASGPGPAYVAALRGPFPGIDLVPVGGVGADDVAPYLRAGAVAVGVGGPLAGDAVEGGDLDALRARARAFLGAVRAASAG